jgi:hypothetical protein
MAEPCQNDTISHWRSSRRFRKTTHSQTILSCPATSYARTVEPQIEVARSFGIAPLSYSHPWIRTFQLATASAERIQCKLPNLVKVPGSINSIRQCIRYTKDFYDASQRLRIRQLCRKRTERAPQCQYIYPRQRDVILRISDWRSTQSTPNWPTRTQKPRHR